jgi:hypothetical protein
MKALFKSRFPFVELPNEELNKEQLAIKKQYNDLEKTKFNQLREVHSDDKRTRRKSER